MCSHLCLMPTRARVPPVRIRTTPAMDKAGVILGWIGRGLDAAVAVGEDPGDAVAFAVPVELCFNPDEVAVEVIVPEADVLLAWACESMELDPGITDELKVVLILPVVTVEVAGLSVVP